MCLKKLVGIVVNVGMFVVVVIDINNMFSGFEFFEYVIKEGVQLIIGCQVNFGYVLIEVGKCFEDFVFIVLLVQIEQGYMNLMKLNLVLYLDNGGQVFQVMFVDLVWYLEGFICFSGGFDGLVGWLLCNGQWVKVELFLVELKCIFFDCLYVEL